MKYRIYDTKFIDNYLVRHMPLVISGDDTFFDKVLLISRLLNTPAKYKDKSVDIIWQNQNKRLMQKEYAVKKWLLTTYDYFFQNILTTLEQITDRPENCNQLFSTLYEFLEKYLEKSKKNFYHSSNCACNNPDFLVVVSAVMNAVLTSGISTAEDFCCHVLNHCIKDSELRKQQIFSYILFLEYLYYTEQEKVQINALPKIRGINELSFSIDNIYAQLWFIWSAQSDLSEFSSLKHLGKALAALQGIKGLSLVIDYFYCKKDEETTI